MVHICCTQKSHNLLALANREVPKLEVTSGDSGTPHDRCFPSEQLFDHGGNCLGIVGHLATGVGMVAQVAKEAIQRSCDGVKACDEEQEANVEDLLVTETGAVSLRMQKMADQVFAFVSVRRWAMT